MQSNKQKLFIVMRHGERTDLAGLKPKFGQYDPELSQNGCKQAYDAGVILAKKLRELNYLSESTKIKIMSSPYLRTIQTSREFIKGVNSTKLYTLPNEIDLDCRFGELLFIDFFGKNFPKDFLNILYPKKEFEEEVKGLVLNKVNSFDLMAVENETHEQLQVKLKPWIQDLIKDVSKLEYDITILFTHAALVCEFNRALKAPGPYEDFNIGYCEMAIYDVKDDCATFKEKVIPF